MAQSRARRSSRAIGSQIAGAQASTVGKAVAAMHPGPETAIGKTVLCFGTAEIFGELTLGDVGDEADMGAGGAQLLVHIGRGEIATIPGAAEQGDKCPLPRLEGVEDGGELFRKDEQAAVGGRLLIAQSMRRGHWR